MGLLKQFTRPNHGVLGFHWAGEGLDHLTASLPAALNHGEATVDSTSTTINNPNVDGENPNVVSPVSVPRRRRRRLPPSNPNAAMASSSCDDDFPLLSADDQPFAPHHRFNHPPHAASSAAADVPDKYAAADSDPASAAAARKDRPCDDLDSPVAFKKMRFAAGGGGGGDYRKDREEWSDSTIECLLNAYTEKYEQLNRGNLRGRDWEEVAAVVSEKSAGGGGEGKGSKGSGGGGGGKSVEQCKNKVDNLKKRYKAERQRLSNGSLAVSHWPWFKKMEQIVGNSISSKAVSEDDKSAVVVCGGTPSMPRYAAATPSHVGLSSNNRIKSANLRWRRIVFKVNGASLAGNSPQNVDPKVTTLIAREVAHANRLGVEVAIVVGSSNFFRGETWVSSTGLDRPTAQQIGMMATLMNSVLLQASLEKLGVQTRVQSTILMHEICEPYIRRKAIRHLEKGRVVVLGGIGAGTSNSLFTTDMAAALTASEINADIVMKGTNFDGIYECQTRNSNGGTFEHISYREFVARGLNNSMDMTAMQFCEENNIPVVIFDLFEPGSISRVLCGDLIGTLIDQSGRIS